MRGVVIYGATSAIAQAVARKMAERGDTLALFGRKADRLENIANDLRARGAAGVHCFASDLNIMEHHKSELEAAVRHLGGLHVVLLAQGTLGDQQAAEKDFTVAQEIFTTNFLAQASIATHAANILEEQGHGTLALLGSVAGERGRQSNYVYGTAKGAMHIFFSGLRNRLAPRGVRVVTIKLGFVDTPMTAHIEKKGLLWATPAGVAPRILRAMDRGCDVVYVPWFWLLVMTVIKGIPERFFKKLRL